MTLSRHEIVRYINEYYEESRRRDESVIISTMAYNMQLAIYSTMPIDHPYKGDACEDVAQAIIRSVANTKKAYDERAVSTTRLLEFIRDNLPELYERYSAHYTPLIKIFKEKSAELEEKLKLDYLGFELEYDDEQDLIQ